MAAPRIECDAPKYDFGTLIGQEQITHEYVLWNRGDEPLEIVKIKDCCGVKSKIVPMTIPPGSNAVCTSVFTTKTRYGKQNKQILLVTNDKKNLYFNLWMTGTLLKPVEFTPRFIRLNDLLPDSEVLETITATNLLDKVVTLESVSTTITGMELEIIESYDRSWTIHLKSCDPLAIGKINGQVQLNFSAGTMNVPIIGEVKPIIQATPAEIHFSSSSNSAVERLIMLRTGDGRPFEVLSAEVGNAEGSVETQKLAEGKWQINLSVQPDSIQPDSVVIIKTSLESQRIIEIPLSL